MNDPLICSSLVPYDLPTKNPHVILATTQKGGHLAWCVSFLLFFLFLTFLVRFFVVLVIFRCEGTLWPNTKSWIDRVGAEFLAAALRVVQQQTLAPASDGSKS
jgi:hypothetical protein